MDHDYVNNTPVIHTASAVIQQIHMPQQSLSSTSSSKSGGMMPKRQKPRRHKQFQLPEKYDRQFLLVEDAEIKNSTAQCKHCNAQVCILIFPLSISPLKWCEYWSFPRFPCEAQRSQTTLTVHSSVTWTRNTILMLTWMHKPKTKQGLPSNITL